MKEKRLTLNNVWELCVDGLWKYVAKRKQAGDKRSVYDLKVAWMRRHDYEEDEIQAECFFCEYNNRHYHLDCRNCPGKLVDATFSCSNPSYSYKTRPYRFYRKLLALDKKRRARC